MESVATFSEFALALAGFSAIALVFGQRQGAIPAGAVYVVRFMVVNALGSALLASLALALAEMGVAEPALWQICSGIYLVVALFFAGLSMRHQQRLSETGELVFSSRLNRSLWAGALLAHAIQVANLVGFPIEPSAGLFLLGLWVLVAVAGAQFIALLFLVLR